MFTLMFIVCKISITGVISFQWKLPTIQTIHLIQIRGVPKISKTFSVVVVKFPVPKETYCEQIQ